MNSHPAIELGIVRLEMAGDKVVAHDLAMAVAQKDERIRELEAVVNHAAQGGGDAWRTCRDFNKRHRNSTGRGGNKGRMKDLGDYRFNSD